VSVDYKPTCPSRDELTPGTLFRDPALLTNHRPQVDVQGLIRSLDSGLPNINHSPGFPINTTLMTDQTKSLRTSCVPRGRDAGHDADFVMYDCIEVTGKR